MDTKTQSSEQKPIRQLPSIMVKTGMKPTQYKLHNVFRILLVIALCVAMFLSVKLDNPKVITLTEVSDKIPRGSIMYDMISEMEPEAQACYLRSLRSTLTPPDSRLKKYLKGIQLALMAGIISEYVINGNVAKPMGILSKTIIYSAVTTIGSL